MYYYCKEHHNYNAEQCNFGDSLSEMLCDTLKRMWNLGHDSTKSLLVERDLTLAKAISLAQSIEMVGKGAKDL